MNHDMPRRDFLKTAPAAMGAFAYVGRGLAGTSAAPGTVRLRPFDYRGVRLLDSSWLDQASREER